jgi:hypothetical protein
MAKIEKITEFRRLLRKNVKLEYEATEENCGYWFDLINKELFEDGLPRVPFEFKWLRKCWGYYEYSPRKPDKWPEKIIMHRKYPTKRLFVEVLAHEMVHHWQFKKLGWRKVDHNDEFFEWCKKAKNIGLRVDKEQGE